MKDIGPVELKRILNSNPVFTMVKFHEAKNKEAYMNSLLVQGFVKSQIKHSECNLTEFNNIIGSLGFDLTVQQRHEAFLFGLTEQKFSSKAKLFNIINEDRKKVDIVLLAQWMTANIEKIRLKQITKEKTRAVSQIKTKLPPLKPKTKLEQKLEPLIQIFDRMQRIRQENGLIPYNFDEDQDILDTEFMHIPYDPNMPEMNTQLSKLKINAEEQLKEIIELARYDTKIRDKLQEGIKKFQKHRIEANQKMGRAGAINAQKRLAQRRQKELDKLKTVKLQCSDNMVRSANVYELLNTPSPKIKPVF